MFTYEALFAKHKLFIIFSWVEVIDDLHKMFEANLFIDPIQWLQTSDDGHCLIASF